MYLMVMISLSLPPQAPPPPQVPTIPQVVVEATPYSQLLSRIRAGEHVRVASGVSAPAGFELIEIPGEVGLFECFLEAGKPMMRPVGTTAFVQATNPVVCFT